MPHGSNYSKSSKKKKEGKKAAKFSSSPAVKLRGVHATAAVVEKSSNPSETRTRDKRNKKKERQSGGGWK